MSRIAIIGGGIAGLTAAYELEKRRHAGEDLDWQLYEASNRLGGTVETTLRDSPGGRYILEGGPDGWVSEKPWARELAVELGLEDQLITSNDATRKTYIYLDGVLQPMPDRMRMMVPEDLATLAHSPLFSNSARAAYAAELTRAPDLRASVPSADESVASFVRRHFGEEVLEKIGAPLLSGVFGGDVEKLSVRAVMPAFVTMERDHGSLIAAVQARAGTHAGKTPQPIFTTLREGLGALTAAVIARLPPERLHLNSPALSLKRESGLWCLRYATPGANGRTGKSKRHFQHLFLAAPADTARALLAPIHEEAATLIPSSASSAVLAAFCWPAEFASTITLPPGFGFLVPQTSRPSPQGLIPGSNPDNQSTPFAPGGLPPAPALLAATFVDQKFPHRAPAGAKVVRVFFGSDSAEAFANSPDAEIAATAFAQLQAILGPLPAPDPALTTVRRWPRSLPQYEVGHLDRMARLDALVGLLPGLHLLGNGYRGVGLPDLIRDASAAVGKLA